MYPVLVKCIDVCSELGSLTDGSHGVRGACANSHYVGIPCFDVDLAGIPSLMLPCLNGELRSLGMLRVSARYKMPLTDVLLRFFLFPLDRPS